MKTFEFSASAPVRASAAAAYAVIADYRDGHKRIIPRPPFVSLEVEEGGVGAGTVIRVGIRMMGRLIHYRASITEPEPGRVLVERNDNGYETSFVVEPDGDHARVTISTRTAWRPGLLGVLERWGLPRTLRPIYLREIALIEQVARELEIPT